MKTTYADSSFLARLYIPRSDSDKATTIMQSLESPIVVTSLLVFEIENAIRGAAWLRTQDRTKGISREFAMTALAAFERNLEAGALELVQIDLAIVVETAREISSRHAWRIGARPMDTLHVATARALNAQRFLTFDRQQEKLAVAEEFEVH